MKIDFAKRRRVMERSQRLGHCICDVRRPCPCDVFRNDGICPCAGERPDPVALSEIKLTELVRNAGCASKIAPGDLDAVLARLPAVEDPSVISGLAVGDDAAIYRISEDLCLVQTVDVFTPCVDDPHLFGRICAANCLSDIYAMGGEPRTALSILAFPSEKLPGDVMYHLLAGAMEGFQEAGVALVGGHSVKDDEIKLGFAITGLINPHVAATLETPNADDVLVLTKPLGTGVLNFCQQIGRGRAPGMAAAEISMTTLNRAAAEAMKEAGASACTDVTGFGLFAHLYRMLRASQLAAEVRANALPAFDGVIEALREGVIPGAVERNREYVGETIRVEPGVDEAWVNLGFDAQTSGGLLIAVPPERLEQFRGALDRLGATGFVIGKVIRKADKDILVVPGRSESDDIGSLQPASSLHPVNPGNGVSHRKSAQDETDSPEPHTMNSSVPNSTAGHEGCCADVFKTEATPSSAASLADSQKAFGAMMRAVQSSGALDEKTKELILFSLVIQSRCEACFDAHYARARELGLTQSQLDEAAWCAIAMGGAPVRVFYQESLERRGGTPSERGWRIPESSQ